MLGLRADAPGRKASGGVARVPALGTVEERVAALNELDRDVLAATTSRTNAARMNTIEEILSKWGLAVFPPTPMSWKALAATLKAGGYRSAAVYLSTYKVESERRGHHTDPSTERRIKLGRAFGAWAPPCDPEPWISWPWVHSPSLVLLGWKVARSAAAPPSWWALGGCAARSSWPL